MTAWRDVTEADLRKRGLLAKEVSAAPVAPARARAAGEPVRTERGQKYLLITKQPRITMPALKNILGVALSEAFPGVFQPIPSLGIHWGNEAYKVGVNVAGWVGPRDTPEDLRGWTVVPCLPRDVVERMPRLLARIEKLFYIV